MLGQKTSFNKFKTEIMPSVFADHKVMKLKINFRKKAGKGQISGDWTTTLAKTRAKGIKILYSAKAILREKFIALEAYLKK